MATEAFRIVAAIAEQRWGLVTTGQAEREGVTRAQMSRMAASGSLVRIAHGVYRVAGAPELEHEELFATWLALGGAVLDETTTGINPVVVGGNTAARLHGLGNFWPDVYDFMVPRRRASRLPGVRLRIVQLEPAEVTYVEALPILTIERTIADLIAIWADMSMVTDVVRDAVTTGRLVAPQRLATYLQPLAARNQQASGDAFAADLFARANVTPFGWPPTDTRRNR